MVRVISMGNGTVLDLPGRRSTETVSSGQGAVAATLRVVEIAPDRTVRGPHVHNGFEEVIHVLAGNGLLRSDSGDHPISAGDTALVPSGERHATVNTGEETLRLICFFPMGDIRPGTREFMDWNELPDG